MAITIDIHALAWYLNQGLNEKLSIRALHLINAYTKTKCLALFFKI